MKSLYIQRDRKGGEGSYEHILRAEKALGRRLIRPEQIHHADNNKHNNLSENLVVCPNHSYHMLLHIRTKALDVSGDANKRICCSCKKYDFIENMHAQIMNPRSQNPGVRYYHNSCNAEHSRRRRLNRG